MIKCTNEATFSRIYIANSPIQVQILNKDNPDRENFVNICTRVTYFIKISYGQTKLNLKSKLTQIITITNIIRYNMSLTL
jgi:hypothetical protein